MGPTSYRVEVGGPENCKTVQRGWGKNSKTRRSGAEREWTMSGWLFQPWFGRVLSCVRERCKTNEYQQQTEEYEYYNGTNKCTHHHRVPIMRLLLLVVCFCFLCPGKVNAAFTYINKIARVSRFAHSPCFWTWSKIVRRPTDENKTRDFCAVKREDVGRSKKKINEE